MSQGGGIALPVTGDDDADGGTDKQESQSAGDQWKNFLEYAQEYKETKGPCVQVWLDADVNYTLGAISKAGVNLPVKHLLSAAVRVFLESNAGEIRQLLNNKPKIII